ncbi:MAG: hypothetical protein NT099_01400, partial [Candidatus Saganbacteria bacterium]|nr:hypothetical protein [Candidatus Saganbacteria bacterium]
MQTKILFFILIFSLLFFSPCLPLGTALFAASLTDANLRDGIGVRALGMGGAFTAVADDPTAVFYNPAGLVSTSRFRLERGYLDSNSQVYKNNDYTIFTYGAFAVSTWLRTTLTGESAAVSAVSYGRDGGNGIWWGFSYKNLTGNLPNSKTTGSSFDLGLLGTFPNNLSWGILFQDLLD